MRRLARTAAVTAVAAATVALAAACSGESDAAAQPAGTSSAPAGTSSPAGSASGTPSPTRTATATPTPAADQVTTLPRGDRQLLPKWRIVAYYGAGSSAALGVLGSAPPDQVFPRLDAEAVRWASAGHPVLPAYELITVVANSFPGPDGKYRSSPDHEGVARYLASARRHRALLILDIQPGRSDFLTEARKLEKWLILPDVALAIDPEWRMGPGEIPGKVIGSVSATEVNAVSSWLSQLTARNRLPQKLLLVHQFTTGMISGKSALTPRPNLAMVFNMDGFGGREAKMSKYRMLAADRRFALGFKLFYQQDVRRFSARELLAIARPAPSVLEYQ